MNTIQKIMLAIGIFFLILCIPMAVIFYSQSPSAVLVPLIFILCGIILISIVIAQTMKSRRIISHGQKYKAKIYGYSEDTSLTVNGAYPLNIRVHYFDSSGKEAEALLPARLSRGSEYPIGMTIDIYEDHGEYRWDPHSLRSERLPREEELMDEKPLDVNALHIIAVNCPHCGASFRAAEGYAEKCPYCGQYINVRKDKS